MDKVFDIYIPELWQKRPATISNCDDKVIKTGDTMVGPLDMSYNKITGLSNEYPPRDDEACRWDHVKTYAGGSVHIKNENNEDNVTIDHMGVHVANGNNVRVNIPGGGGPEIEIRQLSYNTDSSLPGRIRILRHDGEKHYHLGWSHGGTLTLYPHIKKYVNLQMKE